RSIGNTTRRVKFGDEPGVGYLPHPLRPGGIFAISRIGTEAVVQLADTPERPIVPTLALGSVSQPIGAAGPAVARTERKMDVADSPVRAGASKPPAPAAKIRSCGFEPDRIVDLDRRARPVVGDRIAQTQPTIPWKANPRLKCDHEVVVVKLETHL